MFDISIIVPVYNVEKYISKCIESILSQTFTNFELILVNDGSKDKSGIICDQYAKKDNRIRVIHKENGGLSSARNAGLDIAQGEYVAFVDSDDYINKNMYEILYRNIIKTNSDISICNFQYVYDNNYIELNNTIYNDKYLILNNIEALNQLYTQNVVQFVIACNKLYKINIFWDLRYDEGKIHEDEFIIHKLLYKSNKVVYTTLPLYYYFQRKGSITQSKFNINKLDAVYAFEERAKFFYNLGLYNLSCEAQYMYVVYFFDYYYKAKYNILDCKRELRDIKINFIKNLPKLLKNNKYNNKEKLVWIIFAINSKLYEIYANKKGIKLGKID